MLFWSMLSANDVMRIVQKNSRIAAVESCFHDWRCRMNEQTGDMDIDRSELSELMRLEATNAAKRRLRDYDCDRAEAPDVTR